MKDPYIEPSSFAPGQPIPAPSHFPIQWTNPDHARRLWTLDRMHFPDPVPPLIASLSEAVIAAPFNRATEQYVLPVRLSTLCLNTYLYLNFMPVGAPPDFVLKLMNRLRPIAPGLINGIMDKAVADIIQKYLAQLEPVIERLGDHWADEWLPELKQHLAYWEDFNFNDASMPELLKHLEETLKRIVRVWEIHYLIILPTFLAMGQFDELYHDLFGNDDPFGPFRLLQGFDNKFLEADRVLWQLSRQALTLPTVQDALLTNVPIKINAALAESPEGQIFLSELSTYLNEYGQRGHKTEGLSDISWVEDPTPVLKRLQDYLTQPDRDLEADLKAQAVEREQFVRQTRERLKDHPKLVITRFDKLLKAAQMAAFLHEEHNYWIDQRAQYQVRRVILEFGRRFAEAGVLDQPHTIFYLTIDEVRETAQSLPKSDRRALVIARQAEMAHFRAIAPPLAIGAAPLMKPPDDPFGRSFGKVLGGPPIPTIQATLVKDSILRGRAASPGVVRGRAKVIQALAEVNKLQPGDILVAEAVMPPWTPLFGMISAVVTDVGGILSHCAIVAREYQIPAVVGVNGATTVIRDGQMIEVDGGRGLVHLLDE